MDSKNFLFCSLDESLIGDIAWQVSKEDHNVKYYIKPSSKSSDIADGFVEKINDWREEIDWADIIVFDDIWINGEIGVGKIAKNLREKGKKVIGGVPETDRLEEDRGYAMEILSKYNINILPHREFSDFEKAISYIKENPNPYVIKPSGEVQNIKRLLYVGKDKTGKDVIDVLKSYKKAWGDRIKGFQLQKKANGVEVAISGFFNGNKFIEPVNINFENKKLFPGNIGPSTGEMGTSMFWTNKNKLYKKTLGKLEEWLTKKGYIGCIDLNCIANNNGIYPLEFTPRFGYPTISIQEEGIKTSTAEFLYRLANGEDFRLNVYSGYQIGVRICVPPFPFDDEKMFEENSKNAPILFNFENRDGFHIEDVKKEENQWRIAGNSGIILIVTGKGPTMRDAQKQAYKRIEKVTMPNMYYRDDIGERWIEKDGDLLQAYGYLGP